MVPSKHSNAYVFTSEISLRRRVHAVTFMCLILHVENWKSVGILKPNSIAQSGGFFSNVSRRSHLEPAEDSTIAWILVSNCWKINTKFYNEISTIPVCIGKFWWEAKSIWGRGGVAAAFKSMIHPKWEFWRLSPKENCLVKMFVNSIFSSKHVSLKLNYYPIKFIWIWISQKVTK